MSGGPTGTKLQGRKPSGCWPTQREGGWFDGTTLVLATSVPVPHARPPIQEAQRWTSSRV
eukprot:239678-Alexandrium_andersonii.AAC.1